MNVAIIGTGLIGRKRALALPETVSLKIICGLDEQRGRKLAQELRCDFEGNWIKAVNSKDVKAVFICVTNNNLAKIAVAAIKKGKHVLIEKPGGLNLSQLKSTYQAYKKNKI